MKKLITWMDKNFEPIMMVILFICMSCLICIQVILRFCFNTGISWAEECSRFLFVWLMYFSIAESTKKNRNIKISYFISKLNEKSQKYMFILSDLLIFTFSAICLFASYKVCFTTARFNDRAVTMDISLNFIYAAGFIGFILMTLRICQKIYWKIKHFNSELEVFEDINGVYSIVKENNIHVKTLQVEEDEIK